MALIIGTAGHVDHGKTELIKALTGIDTDRLPEEKERGMTIVLGFAYIDLPDFGRVGIIDVPGHEKFLKNMITGVYGIDIALLVVSADEGVKPQTEEHFDILKLAEIKKLIIVMTKIDLVSDDKAEETIFEINTLLEGSEYEDSEIIKVSSKTGAGIEELKRVLGEAVKDFPSRNELGIPVLPIDRTFMLKGVGIVGTGSLISGTLRLGDKICLYPQKLTSKIKQIQVHGELKNEVKVGHRVAINPSNIKNEDINIGNIISSEGGLITTKLIDVKLKTKSKIVLKEWMRVKVHILTDEVIGRITPFGEGEYRQILLEQETTTWFKNKFVIRNYSPEYLIGGGEVLNPVPGRHKKKDEKALQSLKIRGTNDMETVITEEIKSTNWKIEDLKRTLFTPDNEFDAVLRGLIDSNKVKIMSKYIVDKTMFENVKKRTLETMEAFYKTSSGIKLGIHKEELRKKLQLEEGLFDLFIAEMKEIEVIKDRLKLTSWKALLSEAQLKELERIEELSRKELCAYSKFDRETIKILEGEGKVVIIKNEFFVHKDVFEKWKQLVIEYMERNKQISIADIKGILNVSRKYAVNFAEYLDEIRLTKRVGDVRILV